MPELPEVETIVRDLRPHLVGRTIRSAKLSHDDVLRDVSKRKLVSSLAGARIAGMTRRAKHAIIELELASTRLTRLARLVIQPGMTGSLTIADEPLKRADTRYAVLRVPARRRPGAGLPRRAQSGRQFCCSTRTPGPPTMQHLARASTPGSRQRALPPSWRRRNRLSRRC